MITTTMVTTTIANINDNKNNYYVLSTIWTLVQCISESMGGGVKFCLKPESKQLAGMKSSSTDSKPEFLTT